MWQSLLSEIPKGNFKALARAISLVENELPGFDTFLQNMPTGNTPVTGITGPPGAGKSTLVDALVGQWVSAGKKVAVLCVDPSSPFHLGALLGDRIRMSEWYNQPLVYIRSLATRGSLGGLHPHILAIVTLLQAAHFDHIIVETVGVGQSEIEITGLADTTVVVLVPEAGDEVQHMKAGIMEIADIFVVNKADRPGADRFTKNLQMLLSVAPAPNGWELKVLQTVAHEKIGIEALVAAIEKHIQLLQHSDRKIWLLTEKAWQLIQRDRMKGIDKKCLYNQIGSLMADPSFNLFSFCDQYANTIKKNCLEK
jgi:LAO/AO transport system kinase